MMLSRAPLLQRLQSARLSAKPLPQLEPRQQLKPKPKLPSGSPFLALRRSPP